MIEKEAIKYQKYLKIRDKKKTRVIDKIRYYDLLKDDYNAMAKESQRKQNKIEELKRQLSAYKIKGELLEEELKTKKGKKKNGR